jgi:S1-C subfamily serine protease
MRIAFVLVVVCGVSAVTAVVATAQNPKLPTTIESSGARPGGRISIEDKFIPIERLRQAESALPMEQILAISNEPFAEAVGRTRTAKDAEVYRITSPSVVRILTNSGSGTGTLIGSSGEILTNFHVVKGQTDVAVVFKPTVEGIAPTRDEIKLGRVIKHDETADLALVQVVDVPGGRIPLRLGDSTEMAIGSDARAIGHPMGEAWTFTKGVISQYRVAYEWTADDINHKADVIQTQTPINPGNSGGPLISDSGALIGVNTFKEPNTEGLNFSVSVDEVRKFIARKGDRDTKSREVATGNKGCELREISRFRSKEGDATVIAYDTGCTGKANANYIIPDSKTESIRYAVDRNGDGRPDVIYFDLKQQKKWDLSFWDEKFEGHWSLVGYHPDGKITPSNFESYDVFQHRLAKR